MRAHLEDARQDNRRISDENRDYLSELNERRSQLTKIDEVKRAERESLLAANQQVAKLKAQLQQASDGKISKKTGGLRVSLCFRHIRSLKALGLMCSASDYDTCFCAYDLMSSGRRWTSRRIRGRLVLYLILLRASCWSRSGCWKTKGG